jgi:hypothetical protein
MSNLKLKATLLCVLMALSVVSFGKEYRYKKSGGKKHWLTGAVTYRTLTQTDNGTFQNNSCIGSGNETCHFGVDGGSGSQFADLINNVEMSVAGGTTSGNGQFSQDGQTFTYSYTGSVDSEGLVSYDLVIHSDS